MLVIFGAYTCSSNVVSHPMCLFVLNMILCKVSNNLNLN